MQMEAMSRKMEEVMAENQGSPEKRLSAGITLGHGLLRRWNHWLGGWG